MFYLTIQEFRGCWCLSFFASRFHLTADFLFLYLFPSRVPFLCACWLHSHALRVFLDTMRVSHSIKVNLFTFYLHQ
jgi:hypothetical protein